MTDPEIHTDTEADNESPAAGNEYVDVPRSTVEALVKFADSELDSLIDYAVAFTAIRPFVMRGATITGGLDTVQLPRETVATFERYFSEFDTDDPDVSLLFDEEFWAEFDDATATARQALTEQ